MGGIPQKPKIQGYIDRQWFDEFEVYRSSHNLNQSKALESILAEFFGGVSKQALPSDGLNTVATTALVDALRGELAELKHKLEQRLQLVESRLGLKSADESATVLNESASIAAGLVSESAPESADTMMNGLATDLMNSSAAGKDEAEVEAVNGLVDESVVESANPDITTALDEVAESAANSAIESAGEIEEALILNTLEDKLETATPSGESVEVSQSATNNTHISDDAVLDESIAPSLELGIDNDDILPGSIEPLARFEAPTSPTVKPGKQRPEEIKKIVEAKLPPGQKITTKELAALIGKSSEAVRQRRDTGRLPEWGVRLVPGSRPEEFERI
jgi:hypothetical protein